MLEGVMMKAGKRTVTTCRKENGELAVYDNEFVSIRQKHKILGLPIIRGVVNFIEMMSLSMKTLNASADALGIEEEETPDSQVGNRRYARGRAYVADRFTNPEGAAEATERAAAESEGYVAPEEETAETVAETEVTAEETKVCDAVEVNEEAEEEVFFEEENSDETGN